MLTGEVEAKWAGGLITAEHARRLWEAMPLTIPAPVEHASELVGSFVLAKGLYERAASFAPADASWFKQLVALTNTDMGAKLVQQRIFAQYTAALNAIASQRPLLLILEDLHWLDSASSACCFTSAARRPEPDAHPRYLPARRGGLEPKRDSASVGRHPECAEALAWGYLARLG
jgi:hypothetical protein